MAKREAGRRAASARRSESTSISADERRAKGNALLDAVS